MKRPLLLFSMAFAMAAIYVCLLGFGGGVWVALGAGICCAGVFFFLKKLRPLVVLLLGFAVGLLWCSGYTAVSDRRLETIELAEQTVSATAMQRPQRTQYGYSVPVRFLFENTAINGTLYFGKLTSPIEPGDRLCCTADLKESKQNDAWGTFNLAKGIELTATAKADLTVEPAEVGSLSVFPARLSCRLQDLCARLFSENTRGFLTALLTGNRAGVDSKAEDALQMAGIYHVVAVSGMHVATLVGAVYLLFRQRRLTALVGIPLVALFVLASGASASAMRAGVMQSLFLCSFLLKREPDPPTSLGAAMLVLLLVNPWAICGASLQLSFAAVGGILLFAGRITQPLVKTRAARFCMRIAPLRWIFQTVVASFACSLSATAFTLPLMIAYFGYYSLFTPLSNTLMLWAVILAFSVGLAAVLAAIVFLPLGMVLAKPVELLARYVLTVSGALSKIPFSVAYIDEPYFAFWLVLAYGVLLTLLIVPKLPKLMPVVCLAVLYGVCILLSSAELQSANFSFTALDVGQGQCLVLSSKGKCAVIDCGGSTDLAAARKAIRHLNKCGAREINALVLTHFDRDHIGGVAALMERFPVRTLYIPQINPEKIHDNLARILAAAEAEGTTICEVSAIERAVLGGMRLQILDANENDNSANSGICVLASYEEYDILVTGDLSLKEESNMLLRYRLPQTELLVAGHHGSEDASGYGLLQTLRPDCVFISVGKNNYGQPSEKTMERIRTFGAEIYRTDQCGSMTVRR